MGSSQTKEKSSSPSEKVVEGLKEKVRLLQGEMKEIMRVRETERQAYEREAMVSAFKEEEWKRERKSLKEEVEKLRKILDQIKDEEARRDETLEKWKQLYFTIKVELDDLIHITRQDERLWRKKEERDAFVELKQELAEKEERIELLQAKLASMENQELRREREMDILRQSMRILSHKKRPTINFKNLECGLRVMN